MNKKLHLWLWVMLPLLVKAQQGLHGNYTASGSVVVNAYTNTTADLAVNSTVIQVANNTLTNSVLTTNLGPGDLILIIQMQGVDVDINTTPVVGWGGNYTISNGAMGDLGNMNNYRDDFGTVTNYKNAGKYEFAQVASVSGTTSITVNCGLTNAYTSSGHVQIVRVPRFNNLTLSANSTIIPATWNGVTGGIVAIEVNDVLSFGSNSKISASGYGFRGGQTDPSPSNGPAGSATDVGKPGYNTAADAAEKGEGIGGAPAAEYVALCSRYGLGSIANGGGGGNYRNAGGGGGSNVGSGTYYGYGVPNTTYATNWNLELAGMSGAPSSGGGKGGYSFAVSDQNENTLGPGQTAWSGDFRRNEGGLGGHPLTYDASRIFMGGGGGSGEQDGDQAGSGGNGGGIVFITSYGSISGTGTIESKGAWGRKSNPLNQAPAPTTSATQKRGNDGAGGGGAGGSIFISNTSPIPASITLNANGGNGGADSVSFYSSFNSPPEAQGPGGGGTGGFINYSSGTPVCSVLGGTNGIVKMGTFPSVNIVSNFPPNGATSGANGVVMSNVPVFNLTASNVTICQGQTANLSATIVGTQPSGTTITWYNALVGGSSLGTGLNYTTAALTSNTTFYVGICPGTFRVPVVVTVNPNPVISTATMVITNATCGVNDGAINGISATGTGLSYLWSNGTTTLSNSSLLVGNYGLTVTSSNGCSATLSVTVGTSCPTPIVFNSASILCVPNKPIQFIWNMEDQELIQHYEVLYSMDGLYYTDLQTVAPLDGLNYSLELPNELIRSSELYLRLVAVDANNLSQTLITLPVDCNSDEQICLQVIPTVISDHQLVFTGNWRKNEWLKCSIYQSNGQLLEIWNEFTDQERSTINHRMLKMTTPGVYYFVIEKDGETCIEHFITIQE